MGLCQREGAGSIPLSGSSCCYCKVNEHPGHLTHGHIRKMYVVRGNYVETLRKSLDSLIVVIIEVKDKPMTTIYPGARLLRGHPPRDHRRRRLGRRPLSRRRLHRRTLPDHRRRPPRRNQDYPGIKRKPERTTVTWIPPEAGPQARPWS